MDSYKLFVINDLWMQRGNIGEPDVVLYLFFVEMRKVFGVFYAMVGWPLGMIDRFSTS